MSVNYHAYLSRGVPFSNYEVVCGQWRETFTGYDTKRIMRLLHLHAEDGYLYVPYLGCPYRLRISDGVLEKQTESGWNDGLYFNEAMAIYHLLYHTADTPTVSGRWVPSHTIDGVVSRSGRTSDPLYEGFCREWSGRASQLAAACRQAGGQVLGREEAKGDVAYQFQMLPCVDMRLVFWDADEDFPAQVQILLDQKVTDFVHYETVGCMISDLFEKLSKEKEQ